MCKHEIEKQINKQTLIEKYLDGVGHTLAWPAQDNSHKGGYETTDPYIAQVHVFLVYR